jgi:short-chain fatty acids transporter
MAREEKSVPRSNQSLANGFSRMAVGMADWSERWFSDALVFALAAIFMVFLGALLVRESPKNITKYFGDGCTEPD